MFCVSFPIALGLCFPDWHVKHLLLSRTSVQKICSTASTWEQHEPLLSAAPHLWWMVKSRKWGEGSVLSQFPVRWLCPPPPHLCSLTTKWQCPMPCALCSLSLCPGLFPTYTGLRMLGLWGWSTGHPKVHWNPVVLPNSRPRLSCSVYINPDSTFSPSIF